MISDVVFVDGVRTPFGKAKGMYANTRTDDLIVATVRDLMRRNPGVPAERIDDVAIATASQTGDAALNIGRMTAVLAGLPKSVPGYSVDRLCAGAMTAVTSLAGAIGSGAYDLAIAGGVEHMTRHPMGEGIDPNPRFLAERLVEIDALNMGVTAENLHDMFPAITKGRCDAYSVASQNKTAKAYVDGIIQADLVPIEIRDPESGWSWATVDEPPRPDTTLSGIANLKTPFRSHGRVTAANASPLTDGATACLLASASIAKELGLAPRMRMVGFAFAGVDPEIMGFGPVPSTEKALAKAGLTMADIGLIEVNEAFAVQVLAFLAHFGVADDDDRVNPFGGAIAVGHPLAASGIRLMANLSRGFAMRPSVRYGITSMCIGLGMGGTVIWERVDEKEFSA